jgi:hypothetical protein
MVDAGVMRMVILVGREVKARERRRLMEVWRRRRERVERTVEVARVEYRRVRRRASVVEGVERMLLLRWVRRASVFFM